MSNRLNDALFRKARSWAGQLTSLARSFAPSHVGKAIHSKVEEGNRAGQWIIRVEIDVSKVPDAAAWEFGSGIHARKGPKHKYPIRPKAGNRFLAFNWEVANMNPTQFKFLPDGRVLLPSVQHPGIEAANNGAGYVRPAMAELRKRGKGELSKEVKQAILGDLRSALKGTK